MRLMRWCMGALVALWTLRGVVALVQTALGKVGIVPLDSASADVRPFVEAVTPLQLALWGIAYSGFAAATWRYFAERRALAALLSGLVVDVLLFMSLWPMPSYQSLASARNLDLAGLALLCAMAILTWWSESRAIAGSSLR